MTTTSKKAATNGRAAVTSSAPPDFSGRAEIADALDQGADVRKHIHISAPRMRTATFRITGTAPYVQSRFSYKTIKQIEDAVKAGNTQNKGKKRPPRDFEDDYRQSQHVSTDGWIGMPASAFRVAMVDACRAANYVMTKAKMAVFIEADGFDALDGKPLIRIVGRPEMTKELLRNDTGGPTIRVRTMWRQWFAEVRIRFDEDMFTLGDAANLLMRVGEQVGIGEGRPYSRNSTGCGWGTFRIEEAAR